MGIIGACWGAASLRKWRGNKDCKFNFWNCGTFSQGIGLTPGPSPEMERGENDSKISFHFYPIQPSSILLSEKMPNCQLPNSQIAQIAELPNCRIAELSNCQIVKLSNCQIPKLPNCRIPKLPNSRIPKLPNSRITKLPSWNLTLETNFLSTFDWQIYSYE